LKYSSLFYGAKQKVGIEATSHEPRSVADTSSSANEFENIMGENTVPTATIAPTTAPTRIFGIDIAFPNDVKSTQSFEDQNLSRGDDSLSSLSLSGVAKSLMVSGGRFPMFKLHTENLTLLCSCAACLALGALIRE
jgi:hypothetical protein